jgi:NIPSNAP
MVIEMRTYKTKPGMRSRFLEIFRSKSVPKHAELGMRILGPFTSIEDPDVFFFMRGFPDLASREPMKASFYEGDLWKNELEHVLMPMLERYEAVLVEDAEGLIRWEPPTAQRSAAQGPLTLEFPSKTGLRDRGAAKPHP